MPRNTDIRGFFKPFTIPRNKRPDSSIIYDEIVVSTSHEPRTNSTQTTNGDVSSNTTPTREADNADSTSPSSLGKRKRHSEEPVHRGRALQLRQSDLEGAGENDASSVLSSLTDLSSEKADLSTVHGPSSPIRLQEDLLSPVPGAVRRIAKSVEIRSPMSSEGTPQPVLPTQQPSGPNVSFGAASSNSHSSSRRVKMNGLPAVTNSDSDSLQDSDDGLADVSTFIPKRREVTPPLAESEKDEGQPTARQLSKRQSARLSAAKHEEPRWRPPPPSTTSSRTNTLKSLLNEKKKRDCSDAWIAETEAEIEQESRQVIHSSPVKSHDYKAIVAALADDSDEQERIAAAIERTEALQQEEMFYFFGSTSLEVEYQPIPADRLPKARWAQQLRHPDSHVQSCLTGFIADVFRYETPPLEILEWMANQAVLDNRTDLCEAYVEIIRTATQNPDCKLENLATLRTFYDVRPLDVSERKPDLDNSQPQEAIDLERHAEKLPQGLEHAVRIVSICASTSSFNVQARVLCELALLNSDACLNTQLRLQQVVQHAFTDLLDCVDSSRLDTLWERLSTRVIDNDALSPDITLQAIAALPTNTPRAHALRRTLALNFFTESWPSSSSVKPQSSTEWTDSILDHLRHNFVLTEQTDYIQLAHLTAVLDIAVDGGFSDFAFLSRTTSDPVKAGASMSFFAAQREPQQSTEEMEFNKSVDKLSKKLRLLANQIQTSGTSHFHRTEARSTIERLVLRLNYTVRTRPKPVKGVFAGRFSKGSGGSGDSMVSLDRFFRKDAHVVDERKLTHEEGGEDVVEAEKVVSLSEPDEPLVIRAEVTSPS